MTSPNDIPFSEAEMAAITAQIEAEMNARNQRGLVDFQGLNPAQMRQILYHPFESPQVLEFSTNPQLPDPTSIPILHLYLLLAEGLGENGIKPTATGNLPPKLCRDIALAYMGEEGYALNTRHGGINTEPDFNKLHITRLVAGLAGLLRKHKGRLIIPQKVQKQLQAKNYGSIYRQLLETFALKYNWGYSDRHPELRIIQTAFAFHLYLLSRFGSQKHSERLSDSTYSTLFIQAFPMALDELQSSSWRSPAEQLRACYELRVLHHFAAFFGLVHITNANLGKALSPEYMMQVRPLLAEVVRFAPTNTKT